MTEEQKEILIKKFIDGKSYEDLGYYFKDINFEGDQEAVLREIYHKHQPERERVAIRDLKRAMGLLLGFIVFVTAWILGKFTGNYLLVVASGFIWIPFFRSFWVVYKSRDKFKQLVEEPTE